jgi:translation initiation factor IF-2
VKQAMAGELGPEIIVTVLGRARVQEVFPGRQEGQGGGPAGARGRHQEGAPRAPHPRGCHRLQDDDLLARRFKDDVAEVRAGLECGVLLADTNDIKPGDHLEVFEVEERARTL